MPNPRFCVSYSMWCKNNKFCRPGAGNIESNPKVTFFTDFADPDPASLIGFMIFP